VYILGQPIECVISDINSGSRTLLVKIAPKKIQTCITRSSNLAFNSLVSGMLLDCIVKKTYEVISISSCTHLHLYLHQRASSVCICINALPLFVFASRRFLYLYLHQRASICISSTVLYIFTMYAICKNYLRSMTSVFEYWRWLDLLFLLLYKLALSSYRTTNRDSLPRSVAPLMAALYLFTESHHCF
jgi:hypothetical protein